MIQFKHYQTGKTLAELNDFSGFFKEPKTGIEIANAVASILASDNYQDFIEGWVYKNGEAIGYLWYYPTMPIESYDARCSSDNYEGLTFMEQADDETLKGVAVYAKWRRPTLEECERLLAEAEEVCEYEGYSKTPENLSIEAGFNVEGVWPCEYGFDPLADEYFDADRF